MSSWVAPSVAAEIWGISVDQIMAGVADGSIPSYVDGQFLFVDVARQGISPTSPRSATTEIVVTQQELVALTFEMREVQPMDEPPAEDEDDNDRHVGSWRTARRQSASTRRPPRADAA